MHAITGNTGQVGGATARSLLAHGQAVRAVLRDPSKAEMWTVRGAEVAVAELHDADALQAAFTDVTGAFVMIPANFTPSAGFPETRRIVNALRAALDAARPERLVVLSTVGAERHRGTGILEQLHTLEGELRTLGLPTAFIRAAWFMENAVWDLPGARDTGELPSFLQPLDRAIAMVATRDIGAVAADLLQQRWTGERIIELEGPRRSSPDDLAAAFTGVLRRPVHATAIPRSTWSTVFAAQGATPSEGRIEMLDGFNSGLIDFFHGPATEHRFGPTPLDTVLTEALARQSEERH